MECSISIQITYPSQSNSSVAHERDVTTNPDCEEKSFIAIEKNDMTWLHS